MKILHTHTHTHTHTHIYIYTVYIWARPTRFQICYLCCFVCYSWCFVVNCDVLCIACKCVLPPGANPIAVDKYINININIIKLAVKICNTKKLLRCLALSTSLGIRENNRKHMEITQYGTNLNSSNGDGTTFHFARFHHLKIGFFFQQCSDTLVSFYYTFWRWMSLRLFVYLLSSTVKLPWHAANRTMLQKVRWRGLGRCLLL
jgi:hypothetical protein